jgi:hypothetical protein
MWKRRCDLPQTEVRWELMLSFGTAQYRNHTISG